VVGVAERLKERNVSFAIVGEGQRAGELEALIREKGLEDRVRLLGLRGDVPELLGSADIYLSTSDWEGMSLTIIEAMGSGLAVVATETEGSKQLLGEDCGVLVPVGDVEAMSRAVVEVLKRREELGRRAERRARAEFGHERMMRELVGVLKRAG
jgi:glycosyltransferase involved in cell wall biosynthesis